MSDSKENAGHWISDDAALAEACRRWSRAEALALDTEFVRERTFRPVLGLVQVAVGDEIALIDPTTIRELEPLAQLLADPNLIKVLHSCSEDLEVLAGHFGPFATPVFDTQLAAAFVGLGYSVGYARLVQALFAHELPKAETRSDWLKRPLSPAQLGYAALDVAYLLEGRQLLLASLEKQERLAWLQAECADAVEQARKPENEDAIYLKLATARGFNRRQLAILRELNSWREREARTRDLPRSFVLPEPALLPLVTRRPASLAQFQQIDALKDRRWHRLAPILLELIARAQSLPNDELPPELPRIADLRPHKKVFELLKSAVDRRALELALPFELLASRRVLETLMRRRLEGRDPLLPRRLRGWREEVIGRELADLAVVNLPPASK